MLTTRTRRSSSLASVLLFAGVALSPGSASANESIAATLNLDAETLSEMERVQAETRTATAAARDAENAEAEALRALLAPDSPDTDAVRAQIDRLGAAQTRALHARIGGLLRLRSLLSPEQIERLREIRADRPRPPGIACREDRERLCGDALSIGEATQCLIAARDQLSSECVVSLRARAPRNRQP